MGFPTTGPLPSVVFEIGEPRKVGPVTVRHLQLYVLPGPDYCNIVITTYRMVDQDGYCGNFNCNWPDDSPEALAERNIELALPVEANRSLFPSALKSPPGWDVRWGPTPQDIMANCTDEVKSNAPCIGLSSQGEHTSCIFDACMKAYALERNSTMAAALGAGDEEEKFATDLGLTSTSALGGWRSWLPRKNVGLVQGAFTCVAGVSLLTLLVMLQPGAVAAARARSRALAPFSGHGATAGSEMEVQYSRLPTSLAEVVHDDEEE